MAHQRPRFLETVLRSSLRFWPVVCLVGSRQVGKSTFLKTLKGYRYLSFDDPGLTALALQNPSGVLAPPCVLDEAQKVPSLFDAVKLDVDREKRPGKFILTGSVRFSRRTLIREALTGRAKTLQMFPMTCSETFGLGLEDRWSSVHKSSRVSRKDLGRYLNRGGMPAIFAVRSQGEVQAYWESVIDSYVHRDLLLAVPKNPRPAIAMACLRAVAEILALGELPRFSRILNKVGGTRAQVERHLQGLEDMMLLHRIPHWKSTAAKDIFLPFDSAFFLTLLGLQSSMHDQAVHEASLYISLTNDLLASFQALDRSPDLHYAVSPKGEVIHLIYKGAQSRSVFCKISGAPVPHAYELRYLQASAKKFGGVPRVLSATEAPYQSAGLQVLPWEFVL